eukprot:gene14619-16134_t
MCGNCSAHEKKIETKAIKKSHQINTPAKLNAPITVSHPNRVKLALQAQRLKCSQLEKEIARMKLDIQSAGVHVPSDLSQDIKALINNYDGTVTPFMRLFWEQQQPCFQGNPHVVRFYPMIIRFCLSLAAKSASACDELRSSKVLTLPSRRTLRDYRNAIKPKVGFNAAVVEELSRETQNLQGPQRYVTLAFDEMKIQSKLVFDKHTKELIGFVDLGDPDLNFACFEKAEELATHVLVFYVHGLASDLKFNLAYFATSCLTSFKIMSLFWKAVSILELSCSLPVIAAVCDGASSNRKFFKMHEKLSGETNDSVTYRTVNLYAPDRYLWFFADALHLVKTARNCLYHSGNNKPRLMWMNGKHLMWNHLCQIVNYDIANGLKICPKLTKEHTELTSYSVMNVRLAAQALSETSANVLSEYYGNAVESTALFCRNMDSFFDIFNVRSPREGAIKRKESLKPFVSCTDARFDWLWQEFLPYLEEWKKSVESTPYKASEKAKMFISLQTFEGLNIWELLGCFSLMCFVKPPFVL